MRLYDTGSSMMAGCLLLFIESVIRALFMVMSVTLLGNFAIALIAFVEMAAWERGFCSLMTLCTFMRDLIEGKAAWAVPWDASKSWMADGMNFFRRLRTQQVPLVLRLAL